MVISTDLAERKKMWVKPNYNGTKIDTWYEEEEYKELEGKLVNTEKVLYNIEEHLNKDEDTILIVQNIEREIKKWKRSLSAKSAM